MLTEHDPFEDPLDDEYANNSHPLRCACPQCADDEDSEFEGPLDDDTDDDPDECPNRYAPGCRCATCIALLAEQEDPDPNGAWFNPNL